MVQSVKLDVIYSVTNYLELLGARVFLLLMYILPSKKMLMYYNDQTTKTTLVGNKWSVQ